jgi:hypothetical protein
MTTADAIARHGRGRVRHRVDRGLWQAPARGLVVTHNGPLTPSEWELVRLTAAPKGSALGGLSALAHDGLTGYPSRSTVLVLPDGARPLTSDDAEIHWSTFLDERDVHPHRSPRRTRVARSLIDAASWCSSDRQARAIVIAGMQQGLTSARHVREALTRRGTCRRRAIVVESVLDAAGGVQSLPERDFSEICASLGWTARRQRAVEGPDGRYFLDAHIPDLGLAIEVHGIPHMAVEQWDADLMRANEIVIASERLLIFSSYAIRHERPAVVDQLRRMAAALGAPA